MGTIQNRKREALSEEEVIKRFCSGFDGIGIEECDDGLCLIYGVRAGYRKECVAFDYGAASNERWWADLRSILKGEFWFKGKSPTDKERIENVANKKLFGLEPTFTLHF
jgi:hypothetical protein